MDHSIEALRYARLRWNCPLSEERSEELLKHLNIGPPQALVPRLVDLGCGWGELLMEASQWAVCTGVDIDGAAILRGQTAARDRGCPVRFLQQRADEWVEVQDRAICIGSSHAFGGTKQMLQKLVDIVPEGRVLVGEMFWQKPPTPSVRSVLGDGISTLPDIVTLCRDLGWQLLHLNTADQQEWDDFESGHRAGPREWLVKHPHDPRAAEIREEQDKREVDYVKGYRGVLGFAYLILAR